MRTCSTVERASVEVGDARGDRAEVIISETSESGGDDKCLLRPSLRGLTRSRTRALTMVAVVTNAIALTRPRVAAPRAARRRVTTAAASPNTSVSAPSSVSNLMPRDRSTTQEIAQVAAKKASVAVPAKGSEPDAAARPFNFAGSAILAFLIGGGLTVFRVLKTKMDEREEALYKAKMEAAQGGAEGGAEGGDEEGPRDRNARTDYSKFKEEMDAAAKEAEDKAEGK